MNSLVIKLKDNLVAVLPITAIVVALSLTLVPMTWSMLLGFLIGSVLIIVGLSFFLLGVDIGIKPIGETTGTTIARTNKLWIV